MSQSAPATREATREGVALTLFGVPFNVVVPASLAPGVRVSAADTNLLGSPGPLAMSKVTYTGADGAAQSLADIMWFDSARLSQLTDSAARIITSVGDRTLVVSATGIRPRSTPAAPAEEAAKRLVESLLAKNSYEPAYCPNPGEWPKVPVLPVVRDVVTAYFQGKELLPVTIESNSQLTLVVQQQLLGVHACFNSPGGGEGAYTGAVPIGAVEAVAVSTQHQAYPGTGATGTFLTLAKVGDSWTVVSEGTGP